MDNQNEGLSSSFRLLEEVHQEAERQLQKHHQHQRDLKKKKTEDGGGVVVEFSSGDLQDVCDNLESEIPIESIIVEEASEDDDEVCRCDQKDDTTVELSCNIDDACISSDGMLPAMQGDYSLLLRNEGVGDIQEVSYAQTIAITSCFQYPSDMYNGSKVCFTTIQDGFSINSQCQITVVEGEEEEEWSDDNQNNNNTTTTTETKSCLYCRFCSGQKLTFNCTNIGYEDKSNCVANNVNGSLLQFLFEPDIVNTCPTSSPTSSPTTTDPPTTTIATNGENSHAINSSFSSSGITNILVVAFFVCHFIC